MRKVVVGCAGWSIPGRYRDLFADGDSGLAWYASRFPIVEINSSFYRPHQHATYARWAGSVPRGFRFSVKMPRLISHELALRGCGPALDAFLAQASGLGARLGGYLLVFLSTDPQNSGTGIGPAQFTWLRRLLARNRTTPTIVFFHAPLRGTQAKFRHYIDRPSAIAQPETAVEELLTANPQVFLWVSGHTHTPPTEPSYAAPINRFQDRVTNIHNTDLRGAMLWTNSLFLCPDRVEVRTYNHTTGHCLPAIGP